MRVRVWMAEHIGKGGYRSVPKCSIRAEIADDRDLRDLWIAVEDAVIEFLTKKRAEQHAQDLTGG